MFAAELWYRVLNTGLRCALSAGSDAFTNIMMHWVPGGGRVYVKVPGDFSYQAWIDNYRKGRSFVTNGPYLTLRVNGKEPGEELQLSAGQGPAATGWNYIFKELPHIHFHDPFAGDLEILCNGRIRSHQSQVYESGKKIRIDQKGSGREPRIQSHVLGDQPRDHGR